ncbi:MAG: hypothetical protein VYB22_04495, partial [Pseudomonadota bacterium]|nr:hypothetical protein [Pseudomonadota bacterium]
KSILFANQSRLEHQIDVYRAWLEFISSAGDSQFAQADGVSLQQSLKLMVPMLKHACVFEQDLLTPESDCMPMSYLSLDVMRSLDDNNKPPLVLIDQAQPSAHVLLATRLQRPEQAAPVKLLLALQPAAFFDGIQEKPLPGIYLEIGQGEASGSAIRSFGDIALKQGDPALSQAIAGSQWQLRLWTADTTSSLSWSLLLSTLLLVAIAWLLREWWYNRTLRHDSAILEEQLSDLQQLKMRNHYPLINPELLYVCQTIYQIGIPQRNKNLNKQETQSSAAAEAPDTYVAPQKNDDAVENEKDLADWDETLADMPEEATEPAPREDVLEYEQTSMAEMLEFSERERQQRQSDKASDDTEALVEFDNHRETLDISDLEVETRPDQGASENETLSRDDEPLTLGLSDDDEDELPDALTQAEQSVSAELTEQAEEMDRPAEPDGVVPSQAIFRKYDIRGVVGEQLTVPVMRQLGRAVGSMLVEMNQPDLNVGCDARLSSPPLTKAFIRGVMSTGCHVHDHGQIPTPLLYFANVISGVRSGAMITGSHNPTDFNGLKLVINGKALLGDEIQAIYQRIKDGRFASGKGMLQQANYFDSYLQKVQEEIKAARQLTVVVDCANSIAGKFLPKLLRATGCKVIELYCDVDGRFPNHHPDPGQPDNLSALQSMVKSNKADLGIAVDGDADRLGVVDNQGKIIWP